QVVGCIVHGAGGTLEPGGDRALGGEHLTDRQLLQCPAGGARRQRLKGAVGQCVQKVAEAEALAWGGVPDILVSNEVVGAGKLARLAALAPITRIAVCADDAAQVRAIESAAADAGTRLPVLV